MCSRMLVGRLAQMGRIGDDELAAALFDKIYGSDYFRLHAARTESTLVHQSAGFDQSDPKNDDLIGLFVIEVITIYSRLDDHQFRVQTRRQKVGGQVIVYDGIRCSMVADIISHHHDYAFAGGNRAKFCG